ncbi:MAG: pyruvate dehydrogenase complex E1 component subunit beta [Pelagibacterales bacterium]|nr:pyruvate dehydrogenase complex E1 component subunit beta [Pelagibacterales bacterium]|tara:strand:- start:2462 stop:3442 length:981 start_codon:yes stop_codon:yes gene_type:complete
MANVTVRLAIRDAIAEEMRKNPDIFLIGEEVGEYEGAYKVSQGLLAEFGNKRIIDTPITEAGFTGLAVGAAMGGLVPIVEFMTWNFAFQAIDQIINSAAKTLYMSGGKVNIPIVFRGPNGSALQVAAQHSHDLSSIFSNIPGLVVLSPYDSADAKGMLKAAINSPNPVIFLENEILYNESFEVPDGDYIIPIGKASIKKSGKDITLVSFSRGVHTSLEASKILSKHNINAEVIDLRSLRPIDFETIINSVKKTNNIITVEEGWLSSGLGAEIISRVSSEAFNYLDAPPLRIGALDVPLPYAKNLEEQSIPTAKRVAKECLYHLQNN